MKRLHGIDVVFLAYLGIIAVLLLLFRPPGTPLFLAFHAAGAGLIFAIAWAHERHGGRFWNGVRYWYTVPGVMACFRQIHYLAPSVQPFEDPAWDRALAALDRRWFGDVDAFCLNLLNPFTADLLHFCYASYFLSMLVLAAVIHLRGEYGRLREYVCVQLTSILLSYLFYFAVPAVGPHYFFETRPAVLDGWIIGGPLHRLLVALELRMPDAFPSGHSLMSMVVIAMSWRHSRRTFAVLVVPALGCILATVLLRYHYVIDVVAAVALFPATMATGFAIHRAVDGRKEPTAP